MRWLPFILVAACGSDKAPPETDGPGGEVIEDTGSYTIVYVDEDKDGYLAEDDCNDNDWQINPGAEEICDGKDNDCDDVVDEGFDADGDGALDIHLCENGTDCDETDPEIPSSEIPYDGIDQDCDGSDMADVDRDGFNGRTGGGNDCNDFDDTIHPGATEVPRDDIDQDCNGLDLLDGDGDGFDAATHGGEDCDDDNAAVFPGALDWYGDGEDTDCDTSDGGLYSAANSPVLISGTTGEYELAGHDVVLCDLDTDGLSDVVVTAPYTGDFNGAFGVFYGRNAAEWGDMTLDQAGTYFLAEETAWGFGVACADVNGDGNDDLIVGQGDLQFGPFVSDYSLHIIYGVGGMLPGDIDELDVDATLTMDLGAPGGVGEVQAGLVTASDVSDDGMADIIVDQDVGNTTAGESALWLIMGREFSGVYDIEALPIAQIADEQGDTVSTLMSGGDYYVVGQPTYRPGLPEEETDLSLYPEGGKVAVMGLLAGDYDSISDAARVEFMLDEQARLGSAINLGDFDADGQQDLAIGAPDVADGAGCVYLMSDLAAFASGGSTVDPSDEASHVLCGDTGTVGYGVAVGGDVDGDGVHDLLVAESGVDGVGAVWLVSGALLAGADEGASPGSVALLGIRAQYPSERMGHTMGMADLDGDGLDDLIIGSSHHPTPASVGLAVSGRVAIFLSSRL